VTNQSVPSPLAKAPATTLQSLSSTAWTQACPRLPGSRQAGNTVGDDVNRIAQSMQPKTGETASISQRLQGRARDCRREPSEAIATESKTSATQGSSPA